MKPVKTLARLDRGIVHQWTQDGVPNDQATRDYLADHIFPIMSSELSYWRSLALDLTGKPEVHFGKCTRCGLAMEEAS